MDRTWRRYFDEQLEIVLAALSPELQRLLDEIPVYVEDYPSRQICEEVGVEYREDLQGLFTGRSRLDESCLDSGLLSPVIYLFREGILDLAADESGEVADEELQRQIRITLLHELGHRQGLDEDDLEELGYG